MMPFPSSSLISLRQFTLMVLAVLTLFVSLAAASPAMAQYMRPDGGVNGRPPTFSNYPREPVIEDPAELGAYHFLLSDYQTSTDFSTAKNVALQRICPEGYFTERVVNCLRMIITDATETILVEFQLLLNGYILGLIVLAVTLFGGQILMGTVDKPGVAAFTLLLKIGAVLVFTDLLGGLLPAVFPIMETMAGLGMSYISEGTASPFMASCGDGAIGDVSIWRRVDCIIQRLFTGNIDPDGNGYQVGVLWVLAVAVFWTTFLGPLVFFMMLAMFLMMFLLIIRCVFVFLSAYALLSLLVIISPLLIPLVLFKNTANYFNKWLRQFLSMMIQPLILFAYMSFVFALIDSMFFRDEEYSLAAIIGANWEIPDVREGMDEDTLNEKMRLYAEEYNYTEADDQYINYRHYLENTREYTAIGNSVIKEEQLIKIEIDLAENVVGGVSDVPVVGRAIEAGAQIVDNVAEWGLNAVSRTLIPFHVPRIQPEGRTAWGFLVDLLTFFMVALILMHLLLKFTKDIPRLVQALSSAIRTPGMTLPGEREVYGAIGAVKGATVGVVRGAAVGFVTGGKKGAIAGAVEGGVREGVQGYREGHADAGGWGGNTKGKESKAGGEHQGNIHAQQGGHTDRKILHGEKMAGGNRITGAAKDVAIDAAASKVGSKGGGKGAGAGGAAGGGGKGQAARKVITRGKG